MCTTCINMETLHFSSSVYACVSHGSLNNQRLFSKKSINRLFSVMETKMRQEGRLLLIIQTHFQFSKHSVQYTRRCNVCRNTNVRHQCLDSDTDRTFSDLIWEQFEDKKHPWPSPLCVGARPCCSSYFPTERLPGDQAHNLSLSRSLSLISNLAASETKLSIFRLAIPMRIAGLV